jgi:hypothetical protein
MPNREFWRPIERIKSEGRRIIEAILKDDIERASFNGVSILDSDYRKLYAMVFNRGGIMLLY